MYDHILVIKNTLKLKFLRLHEEDWMKNLLNTKKNIPKKTYIIVFLGKKKTNFKRKDD